ncbi:uncharacterized aarF domain-containing protein kinase 5 isoform X2 [Ceratitis capitata]|uniref:(Mediterranean fruit fly) hypothetical protein n=1 Tax=Ceratitis capitata TaxID=7213 RepID=A0A811VI16_CERCA|nr:uncharacterized aarF domain-containing protein kinase 5 isoform X2 [Ceratitis capitata]CAD7013783.1 unnamed protein product [Ceratitis capitata]
MNKIFCISRQGSISAGRNNYFTHLIRCSKQRNFANTAGKPQRKHHYFGLGLLGIFTGFVTYDGVVNDFIYSGASIRFLRSVKTASLIAIDYFLLERHVDDFDYDLQLKQVHLKSAGRLLETCLLNGGLYIKMGQGVAAINHILPKEYTSTLEKLQDKCLPTTKADVQKVFIKDFGANPEHIYCDFEYTPIAAASLAQVFKAKLKSGEDVAVKVQYGDLQKRFTSDLGTIMFLQDIIEIFFKNYNFGWILRDLRKNLVQELNFENEGQNAERCAKDLEKFKYVHVPSIYWEYTKPRVLTMEWVNGFKVSDVERIQLEKLDLKDVDLKLFNMFAEQIFHTGFVHADPHPGNVYVRKNPKTGQAELVLLDHGLYEFLPESVRLPLCEFWEATVLRDEQRMKSAAQKIGINDHMKFAEVLFQQPIRIHGGRIKTKLSESDIEYIQQVAKKNFELIMGTLKDMPRNMLFVVRNLNTVRAIGRQHGDVVDRPRTMARRLIFEYNLWATSFRLSCFNLYLNILCKLNRAPSSALTLLTDIREQNFD